MMLEGWARDGLTDEQIAHNMGIHPSTYYKYCNDFIEIRKAIKKGKAPVDVQVENALLKRALGYEYTETHIRREVIGYKVENGQRIPILGKKSYEEVVKKTMPPEVLAQIYWLKNRRPDKWRDKPDPGKGANDDPLTELMARIDSESRGAGADE